MIIFILTTLTSHDTNLFKMKKIILLQFFLFNIGSLVNAQCWSYVAGNGTHTLAIKTDSTLWAWGFNDSGQLGNSSSAYRYAPTQVGSASGWQKVSAGYYYSLGIKDGTLWAWGANSFGQLGNGSYNEVLLPAQIGADVNWVSVSCGFDFSIALTTAGTLWAWGNNDLGQLGDGTNSNENTPTQVGTGTDWQSIATGDNFCLAIKNDGTLWAWGYNGNGKLGDGSGVSKNVPTQVGADNDWTSVSAGAFHSLALKTDGTLWGWGANSYYQLGIGTAPDKYIPTKINNATDWKSIAAGGIHSLALKTNGTLWSWGNNSYGQLGSGTAYYLPGTSPAQIDNATDWKSIFGTLRFNPYAIKTDSTLWGWGAGEPIANGPFSNSYVPVQISCGNALPIILASFTGQKTETKVLLKWQTATEQNNKEFQIERRTDATLFEKTGTVSSKNNTAGSAYTYVDAYPFSGNNYYRLKSVDMDGRSSYSNIVEITFNLAANNIIVYPNPAKDILNIQSNFKGEKLYINVTDISGRKILQTAQQNNQLIHIPVTNLKTGFYLLQVSDGVNSVRKKIIKE